MIKLAYYYKEKSVNIQNNKVIQPAVIHLNTNNTEYIGVEPEPVIVIDPGSLGILLTYYEDTNEYQEIKQEIEEIFKKMRKKDLKKEEIKEN